MACNAICWKTYFDRGQCGKRLEGMLDSLELIRIRILFWSNLTKLWECWELVWYLLRGQACVRNSKVSVDRAKQHE